MEEKDRALLREVGKIIAESVLSVFPMLIPKPVEVALGEIKAWKPESYSIPTVLITTKYINGPKGSQYFFFTASTAGIIVDLMTGGGGVPERALDASAKSALKELLNQLLGVAGQGLRDRYYSKLGFDQVEIHTLEPNIELNLLLGTEDVFRIDFNLRISETKTDPMSTFVPRDTLESLRKVFSRGSSAFAAAAPNPAPGAVHDDLDFSDADHGPAPTGGNIDLILDLELPIVIRLGTAELSLQEIMKLASGSVIELNKTVDEPVELLVNNKIIAKGEVVVVEGNFAFRVTDIESKSARIKSLV